MSRFCAVPNALWDESHTGSEGHSFTEVCSPPHWLPHEHPQGTGLYPLSTLPEDLPGYGFSSRSSQSLCLCHTQHREREKLGPTITLKTFETSTKDLVACFLKLQGSPHPHCGKPLCPVSATTLGHWLRSQHRSHILSLKHTNTQKSSCLYLPAAEISESSFCKGMVIQGLKRKKKEHCGSNLLPS